ncbi:MAG: helix-turn-helix domain-containing protein, partial [Pontixanthobacter sp.]
EMAEGERYSVPADAEGPQVWTGQPEALMVSIGGDDIGTLSQESEILRDIPATATALFDRIDGADAQAAQAPAARAPATQGGIEPPAAT